MFPDEKISKIKLYYLKEQQYLVALKIIYQTTKLEIGATTALKAEDFVEEEIDMNTEKISMIIMRCAKKVNGIQFG